ncbi:hypothetical protein [Aliiroseovarius subalbicans]|uniref:hypothetical protein n=1 Tax=Aliiroseovarius subalbicans TaxID=2925840 RepID=UPI001F55DEE1|nr:hypothetical protein [Aliiroseovarius subalbicans]MCI2399956.1 hypothetical protein [Aliiroseovarius subalbicans]
MILITVIVLPTAGALLYYYLSNDPTVRPLGITQQSLQAFETGDVQAFEIVALVSFDDRRSGGVSRRVFATSLMNAFRAKGVNVRVAFKDTGAAGTWVTYQIGPSTVGPFPQSRAADGISAAVEAYRMTVPPPHE